jgi:FKBP-type peptidyl-prolyl cis-trans isomerase SlyD
MTIDRIKDGVVVTLAYTLTADGIEVENATTDDPLDYLHGADNIVPGLERELTGKTVGDKFTITLQPEDAYGDYDDEDIEEIDRAELPESVTVGMELVLEDEDGEFFEVIVKQVTGDSVVLDFNPPLAGKTVTYKVEVLALRQADSEELEHGHPHSQDEDYEYEFYEDEQ